MLNCDRRKRARLQLLENVNDGSSSSKNSSTTTGSSAIPRGFICPLTMEVMYDPVLDAEGNTYERTALLKWLQNNRTSPVSRQPLNTKMVIANNALRDTIHEYMGKDWVESKQNEEEQIDNNKKKAKVITPKQQSSFRAKIDCFLQNTCHELGVLDLKLNDEGCCAFRYDNITVVLDVPESVGVFCLYTKDLVPEVPQDQLYQRALELNFLQGETRGGCLSVRRHPGDEQRREIMFSYTDRVPEVTGRDFSNILLNFVETSVLLREKLLLVTAEQEQEQEKQQQKVLSQESSSSSSYNFTFGESSMIDACNDIDQNNIEDVDNNDKPSS